MNHYARCTALGIFVAIVAGVAACGSPTTGSPSNSLPLPSAQATCRPLPTTPGWSGIYRACSGFTGEITVRNTSKWEVLRLVTAPGGPSIGGDVSLPDGEDLATAVERQEFGGTVSNSSALVPPGGLLVAFGAKLAPVRLLISIDYRATSANVTALGLVSVLDDKLHPVQSEVQSIIDCSDYVASMREQISQWQPSSMAFWNAFANVSACRIAFNDASEALSGTEDDAGASALERAAGFTADFFSDVLPKLIALAVDADA